ncbi:MAG: D-alanyl-D-alanine carboxypeptidase family protein [Nitrospirota bacterium]
MKQPGVGWTAVVGAAMLWGSAAAGWAEEPAVWPKVRAKGLLLVDLEQRRVLYESNSTARLAPASLTKVMTAVIAIDEGDPDAEVTISRHAARATGHRLRLRAGQRFRLGDLIQTMLVTSANDACRAVAEAIGGTETAFVNKMNRYAEALALTETHFANACGFDAPGHHSSAQDLARLAAAAQERPAFAEAVKLRGGKLVTVDGRRVYPFRTTNRLMATFEGMVGVKTGFTRGAGRCLIARVVREQGDVLLVMLNAPRRWGDAATLLTRAFDTLAADRQRDEAGPTWERVDALELAPNPEPGTSRSPLPL